MKVEKKYNQEVVNEIWSKVWQKLPKELSKKELFGQRLFVEGYPVFNEYLPFNKSIKILDAGGETGRYGLKMALADRGREVYVVDILPESIELVKKSINNLGISNAFAEVANLYKLPYPDDFFDVVFCDVVIQHLDSPEKALLELKRVLKKEGRLIVSAVNWWNFPHTFYKFIKITFYKDGYEYGYEKSYTCREFRTITKKLGLKLENLDGFYFAYSIFRWKKSHRFWSWVGRAVNRLVKIIDVFSRRFISRHFGFEIFFVATKVF